MKRRDLIALAGVAVAGWPLAGAAQQRKVPTIGVLAVQAPGSEQFWRMFREDLRELGYIEGQNIRFEFRSDKGRRPAARIGGGPGAAQSRYHRDMVHAGRARREAGDARQYRS